MNKEYCKTRKCNECKKVKPNDEKNYGKGDNAMCNDCYYYGDFFNYDEYMDKQ